MALYGRVEYWNERYKVQAETSETFDWYQTYAGLSNLLSIDSLRATDDSPSSSSPPPKSQFPSRDKCRVLILGCGNSTMAEDMVRDGWKGEIVNVDFSPVVIAQMQSKYGGNEETVSKSDNNNNSKKKQASGSSVQGKPKKGISNHHQQPKQGGGFGNLKFLCADVTERLPFADESFDLIICKGTLDSVLCSHGSVAKALCLVRESVRLLVKGYGVLFLVSYGNKDSRVVFLEHENDISYFWKEVSTHTISRVRPNNGNRQNDHIYICRKRADDISATPTGKGKESKTDTENVDGAVSSPKPAPKPQTTAN